MLTKSHLRLKKGVTQEQLAACVGVSKSAVSKWELGQTCPDISLLPVLAGYFEITVDELLGYESQVSMEEVVRVCDKLSECFEQQSFSEVKTTCNHFICRYASSWPLLFSIGQLLITYSAKTRLPEETKAVQQKAFMLFQRVARESKDPALKLRARQMQAVCSLLMGRTEEAAGVLEAEVGYHSLAEPLLAEAIMERGDLFQAKGIVRTSFLLNLSSILLTSAQLIDFMGEDNQVETFLKAVTQIAQMIQLNRLAPLAYLTVVLAGAKHYLEQGRDNDAVELLLNFTSMFTKSSMKVKVASSQELGSWRRSRALLSIYTGDHTVVHQMMVTRYIKDSAFDNVRSTPVFQEIENWYQSTYAKPI